MSIWKLDKENSKISLKILAWAGLNDVTSMHGYNKKINHQIMKWFISDYGINQEDEPFYAFDIFRSYFNRDFIAEIS